MTCPEYQFDDFLELQKSTGAQRVCAISSRSYKPYTYLKGPDGHAFALCFPGKISNYSRQKTLEEMQLP